MYTKRFSGEKRQQFAPVNCVERPEEIRYTRSKVKRAIFLAFIMVFLCVSGMAAQTDIASAAYGLGASLSASFLDPNAGSSGFAILDIPFGGYAEGMASALTALPVDASAFAINPATSAMLESTELSIFHNNWIGESKLESAIYAIRFGNLGLGLGGKWFYAPFSERDDFTDVAKSYYSETMAFLNASYNFFSGYYFNGLSVGANFKAAYRAMPDYTDDEGRIIQGSGFGQSGLAMMADFGLYTRFDFLKFYVSRERNFSVGLALRNLGFPVSGDSLPTAASIGIAYSPLRPLIFALDVAQPINLANIAQSESTIYALAVDADLFEFFSVHGGFQLKGGNPRVSLGACVALASVDIIANYTLDLTTQYKDLNRFSLEAKLNLGDQGRYAIRIKVEEYYLRGVEAYAKGNASDAIELWTEALKLDPGFDPARENRATARKAIELMRQMDALQRLEQ
jgi:tetratricopeptide (TPR) repeat protein